MKHQAQRAARVAGYSALVLWLAWSTLTLVFANLQPAWLRQVIADVYVIWLVAAAFLVRPARRSLVAIIASGLLVSGIYWLTPASNERDWLAGVAVAATTEINGERVTVRGVRNFHYRSESDFDVRWEDRDYNLSKLRTLDLFMSFWGPVDYCHTILSFGFEGGEQLAVSIEARKEDGESFSTFGGFFKMFELSYIFSDERDVIGLRTNHRGEDVYLYRLRADLPRLRRLFVSYLDFADGLAHEPQFYDVLDSSCGISLLDRIGETGDIPWSGRAALLNGYWAAGLYERGTIDRSLPFEELQALSHINDRARAAAGAADFSAQIRAGLPPAPPSRGTDR